MTSLSPASPFPATTLPAPTLRVTMARGVPRLVAVWAHGPHPSRRVMRAVGLSLAARVELLSEGHGWDVVVIGYAERGNVPAMAVELVLDGAGYECQRAAEGVLEAVAREVSA